LPFKIVHDLSCHPIYAITNHLIEGSDNDTGRSIHDTNDVEFEIKTGIQEDADANGNLSENTNSQTVSAYVYNKLTAICNLKASS